MDNNTIQTVIAKNRGKTTNVAVFTVLYTGNRRTYQ